jgi:hypothetical protein
MSRERRRSARVAIVGRLHGHAISLDVPVKVTDLSLGGMAIETPVSFPVGAVQEFQLTLGDESAVVLRGKVIRSQNVAEAGGAPAFVTGVEFIDDEEPADNAGVGQLIEKLD